DPASELVSPDGTPAAPGETVPGGTAAAGAGGTGATGARPSGAKGGGPTGARPSGAKGGGPAGTGSNPLGAIDPGIGVTGDTIKIVYYWRAGQGTNNPFLDGLGVNSNEGQAFRAWVKYVNAHANGDGHIMGFPFNLHGRKIEGIVVDSGSNREQWSSAAEKIVKEIKPFVSMSNVYSGHPEFTCPIMAKAGILSLATYDVEFDLARRSNGYCLPWMLSFDRQVEASTRYLVNRMDKTPYRGTTGDEKRKYAVAWAEMPGFEKSGPEVVKRLKAAGINVVASASASGDLQTQAQQSANMVAQFRSAGANTVLILDGVLPLTFTNAAESQTYRPDYYVWPGSVQDFPALSRFFNPNQWARASGLSTTDPDFSPDQVHTSKARQAQWWGQYQSVDRTGNPPAQAPLIYQSMLQLVAGITYAGRDLNARTFVQGLERFEAYRYSMISGRSGDPTRMALGLTSATGNSTVTDFTVIRWVNRPAQGNEAAGYYEFLDSGRRYALKEL